EHLRNPSRSDLPARVQAFRPKKDLAAHCFLRRALQTSCATLQVTRHIRPLSVPDPCRSGATCLCRMSWIWSSVTAAPNPLVDRGSNFFERCTRIEQLPELTIYPAHAYQHLEC